MQRIVEPELMNDKEQVQAYASADFEQAHRLIVDAFDDHFPDCELEGHILDLGCGLGDISFRYAKRFSKCVVIGIDGSSEMIRLANKRKQHEKELFNRMRFIECILPDESIPGYVFSAIVSNSLLHHLHRPDVLWSTVKQNTISGTKVLIVDLFRPANKVYAQQIVDRYSSTEPKILRRDFYNSLLAAFTIEEIEQQLADAGLTEFRVTKLSDRHVLIFGEKS